MAKCQLVALFLIHIDIYIYNRPTYIQYLRMETQSQELAELEDCWAEMVLKNDKLQCIFQNQLEKFAATPFFYDFPFRVRLHLNGC